MSNVIMLKLKSYHEDGKFIENETGKELTEDEAIKVVQECWRDMPMDYYSWDLEKVIFKDNDGMTDNIHKDCANYSPKKDYCLKWFEENVSKNYTECKEKTVEDDKELARKWSN